jgi:hypothetical protein
MVKKTKNQVLCRALTLLKDIEEDPFSITFLDWLYLGYEAGYRDGFHDGNNAK